MITKEIVIVLYKVENGTIMETPKTDRNKWLNLHICHPSLLASNTSLSMPFY